MTPHRQLLADYAKNNSQEAFRELVNLYVGMVYSSAVRLVNGDTHLANDIAQTVFADLAKLAHSISPEATIGGWLHRRTCHVALTVMRSERRREIREHEAFEMSRLNDDADEALAQVAPVLDAAIDELTPQDREAIMLRFFEHCDLRAIGRSLGTSEDAAQKRISRALDKLRVLLVRRGVVLSTATLALALGSQSVSAAPAGLALTVSAGALTAAQVGKGFAATTLKILFMTKLKAAVIATVLIASVGTTVVLVNHEPTYTPSGAPNPNNILQEARADTAAGRFPEALAKHVWYHKNALRYEPNAKGVRMSFALGYWAELAEKYPPALKKMIAYRDDAEETVRDHVHDLNIGTDAFIDAFGFNRVLQEPKKTVDLFKWVHSKNSSLAKRVFHVAEPDLVSSREYTLCGQYIEPDAAYQRIVQTYTTMKQPFPGGAAFEKMRMDIAHKTFSNKAATLVALLALNNRSDDANKIATQAAGEWNDPAFLSQLNEAKNGVVPESSL